MMPATNVLPTARSLAVVLFQQRGATTCSFPHHRTSAQQPHCRLFTSFLTRVPAPTPDLQAPLDHAVQMVRTHDPSGYLPGRLLPRPDMQLTYYSVRSFWVETGLRHNTTVLNSSSSNAFATTNSMMSPLEYLDWWQQGIDSLFSNDPQDQKHPTLSLLQYIVRQGLWNIENNNNTKSQDLLNTILGARRDDLNIKQYETVDDLIRHAQRSCAPLLQLVLLSNYSSSGTLNSQQSVTAAKASEAETAAHQAALHVGTCHGITNALRTSIPVVSTTGKLIIPADLCQKYGVKSPRYLLSALGQGDETCVRALQWSVRDLVDQARYHLDLARQLRPQIIRRSNSNEAPTAATISSTACAALLPGLVSETFLNRLQDKEYLLTDRSLRQVGVVEHAKCASRMILAYYQKQY